MNGDRLYRVLERLLPHKRHLEQYLVTRLGKLFALDYDLLLYDVTSTYFEGLAADNALAQRGYSRDHRPDVTTVEVIVEAMEARYGGAQCIWVMDRGMTSEDNVSWRREGGRRYLVGTPKSELRKWARPIVDAQDWHALRDGVDAKQNIDWVTALVRHLREKGYARVEATAEAERGWTEQVHETGRRMLFTQVDAWMMGINSNVPGKQVRPFVLYAGGAPKYREKCDAVAAGGRNPRSLWTTRPLGGTPRSDHPRL